MTNPPDPKTKTPRGKLILEGIGEQNEPATWEGRNGFWVQGDCIFIEAESPQAAIAAYRKEIVATSHNHFCGSIMREKDRFRADALELENQSLTRRLEEAEKWKSAAIERQQRVDALEAKVDDQAEIIKFGSEECDRLNAKLTALRTAAVGALSGFAQALRQWKAYHDGTFEQAVDDADLEDANHLEGEFYQSATAALAALRAELDQADSNASNSPTDSLESQG